MSILEIVLYIGLGLIAFIVGFKCIKKAIRIRKQKKKGTYKPDEDE